MGKENSMEDLLAQARKKARERMGLPSLDIRDRFKIGYELLGTYRIASKPFAGGMGSVWKVRHLQWSTDLAMKLPKAEYFRQERDRENFIRECKVWMELGLHPNIVSCYYVRVIDGIPCIFSEWMDSGSLRERIVDGSLYEDDPAADGKRLLDIAIQTARGLGFAHQQGLIHQDVKSANILLSMEDGSLSAKIADFGLSKAMARLTALEGEDTAVEGGTIYSPAGGYTREYCSMEQLNGEILTRRTDIFSWAVTMLEMYLGERRWNYGIAVTEKCEEYFQSSRVPVPERLRKLLRQCLSAESDARPHDFSLVIEELRSIYEEETGEIYPADAAGFAVYNETAESLNNRALSYLDMGMVEQALETLKDAFDLDISNENVVLNYALAQWRNGRISPEDAVDFLHFIPDGAQAERFAKLFRAEGMAEGAINFAPDWENLPLQENMILVESDLLPASLDGVRCAMPNEEGKLAVITEAKKIYTLSRGGIPCKSYNAFHPRYRFEWAVFLGKCIMAKATERVEEKSHEHLLLWMAESGQLLMDSLIENEHQIEFADAFRKSIGNYWPEHSSGFYMPGSPMAEYRLCRAQKPSERLASKERSDTNLTIAELLYRGGHLKGALSHLEQAEEGAEAETLTRIAKLRAEYAHSLKKKKIKKLKFLNGEIPEIQISEVRSDDAEEKRLAQVEVYRKELLASYTDAYSEYEIRGYFLKASPDESRYLYNYVIHETYDSPAQYDIEESEWCGLLVLERDGTPVYKSPFWHYMPANGCSCCFSPDGRYILQSGEDLYLIDLTEGREKKLSYHEKGSIGFTADSLHAIHLDSQSCLRVYDLPEGKEGYMQRFPAGLCTNLRVWNDDFMSLCINGKERLCSMVWEYDWDSLLSIERGGERIGEQ